MTGVEKSGSTVGVNSIKQCISALERERKESQRHYKNIPDAQISLRDDPRIKTMEDVAKAREPVRIASSQTLKATGGVSGKQLRQLWLLSCSLKITAIDTYTHEQLTQLSMWCLQTATTPKQITEGTRDRTMLLISAQTGFRGDSLRGILLSDLGGRNVPIVDLGPGKSIWVGRNTLKLIDMFSHCLYRLSLF